jgi:N-acetyl sugar amidotransferase
MDTSDPEIVFDDSGVCLHCTNAKLDIEKAVLAQSSTALEELFQAIKQRNTKKEYDGIIGLSGGLDSAYVLRLALMHGLNPLVVHVDAGWNSNLAVTNIQELVETYGVTLQTIVIDWEEMREVQLAYLRSGLMNQDVPQDHAFFASLYSLAASHGISDVITGENIATESILPKSWGYGAMDGRQVRSVAKTFGNLKLKSYPILTIPSFYLNNFVIRRLRVHKPLNLLNYSSSMALTEIRNSVSWNEYEGKHGESMFTSFYQSIYLPERFGIDKRRAHLSSLIISGEITREEAIRRLNQPIVSELERKNLCAYVARRLEITQEELLEFLSMPKRSHKSLANDEYLLKLASNSNFNNLFRRIVRKL